MMPLLIKRQECDADGPREGLMIICLIRGSCEVTNVCQIIAADTNELPG